MKLIEIFNQLTYGELSQISLGGGEVGEIAEKNYPAVMSHVNLALAELYRRFTLKEGRVRIATVAGLLTYSLNSKYAVQNVKSKEILRYIQDEYTNPFKDDVIKIERVLYGNVELGLNDESDHLSVHTPSLTVLRLPPEIVGYVDVVYRAGHANIDPIKGAFNPETLEIDLPYSHLNALLLFIASRVNNPIGMTNEHHAGNSYWNKFEAACASLKMDNVAVDSKRQPNRFRDRGWV